MALPALIPLMVQGGRFALPRIMGMGKEFIAKQGGLPYLTSGSRALVQRANTLPAVISGGRPGLPALVKNPLSIFGRTGRSRTPPSGAGRIETPRTGTSVVPYNAQKGVFAGSSVPISGATSTIPGINKNLLTATGINLGGLALMAPSLEDEAIISAEQKPAPKAGTEGGAAGSTIEETEKFTKQEKEEEKSTEDQASNTEKDIKKGDLDDYIKQNMDIFDKYLGDGKEKTKAGLYNAMVQFGLNLAQAKGGNFADKIARSAKEPMQEFAKLGNALSERADKIKMAAVEQGLKREAEEREFEREKELTQIESEGGTDFQQNLSTIQSLAPNLSNVDQIKLARGLKTSPSKDEFILNNIQSYMESQNLGDIEAARNDLSNIYDSVGAPSAPTVSYNDAFAAMREANGPEVTDKQINDYIASQGSTPSE